MSKINIVLNAAGNWQLATGKFLPGDNGIFGTRLSIVYLSKEEIEKLRDIINKIG